MTFLVENRPDQPTMKMAQLGTNSDGERQMTKLTEAYKAGKEVYDKKVPGEEEMNRPKGITFIAILFIALAVLSLLWSGLVFGVGGLSAMVGSLFGAESIKSFGASSGWSGFLGILIAAVHIAVGVGLFLMKKWAWYLAIVAVGLTVIQGVIGMFGGGLFAFMCGFLGLLIPAGILIYMLMPKVRQAFGI
jgi:hypothetical protein